MGVRLADLQRIWESAIQHFLAGGTSAASDELRRWRSSYRGAGPGSVEDRAFPEPYLGSLEPGVAKAVFLALNPGRADLSFQGRGGLFAEEIRGLGSYAAWARTWPYLRDPWITTHGANRHHGTRLRFLRRWFGDEALGPERMVGVELYPWHSTSLTAPIRPPVEIVHEFVLEPIAELGEATVFAFGAAWFSLLPAVGVEVVARLGAGGRPYGSRVPSRAVLIGRTPERSLVVAEKHTGSASPPSRREVELLRDAVRGLAA
ncbi:MAG: anti-phage DNA glycosylase Brig1, partial [Actinomycetota bacterium]